MHFGTAFFSFLLFHFAYYDCIVCIPHFCSGGVGEGEFDCPTKREKGGIDRTSTFRGGLLGKSSVIFFFFFFGGGGGQLLQKK